MTITIPYKPRPLQAKLHHDLQNYRFSVVVIHRRAGKTVMAINECIRRAATCPYPNPRVAIIFPNLRMAKRTAWDYLLYYAGAIPSVKFHHTELTCTLPNGGKIMLQSSEDIQTLRGQYYDFVVIDEAAMHPSQLFPEIVRPALADTGRKGASCLFISTPAGKNSFYELYRSALDDPEWYTAVHKASETNILDQHELDSARKLLDEQTFEQEFEVSFTAQTKGSYYAGILNEVEEQGRICHVKYDPTLPVHCAFDLGISDSTAIWMYQLVKGNNKQAQTSLAEQRVHILNCYEYWGVGLDHYVKVLNDLYTFYGDDWLPHDARVRELGTGRTRVETLLKMGRKPRVVPLHKVDDGINACRLLLQNPNVFFDAVGCEAGLNALRSYSREWDDRKRVFKRSPKHDWSSHYSDAFRILAMSYKNLGYMLNNDGVDDSTPLSNRSKHTMGKQLINDNSLPTIQAMLDEHDAEMEEYNNSYDASRI